MNFTYERIKLTDLDFTDPYFDSFRDDYKDFDDWINRIKDNQDVYVIYDQGKIVHTFLLRSHTYWCKNLTEEHTVKHYYAGYEIKLFKVAPEYRHRGIAIRAMRYIELLADINHKQAIFATVRNPRAKYKLMQLFAYNGYDTYGSINSQNDQILYKNSQYLIDKYHFLQYRRTYP